MFLYTSDYSSQPQEQYSPIQEPSVYTIFPEHSNSKTRNFQTISETHKNLGLKDLSRIVYEIIQSQKQTNIQLILSEIKKNYPFSSNTVNQQRRIYDCLNVMMTMQLIKKENKNYHFIKDYGSSNHFYLNQKQVELDKLQIEKLLLEQGIENKRKQFQHLTKNHSKLEQLVKRNQDQRLSEHDQIFYFPFLVLKTKLDKQIEMSLSDQEVLIQSNNPIRIESDIDIIIELDFD